MNQVETICQDWRYLDRINRWLDPLSEGRLPWDSVFQEKTVEIDIFNMLRMLERIILHDRDWKLTPFCPDEERRTRIKPRAKALNVKETAELLSRTADPLRCPITAGQLREYLVDRGLLRYEMDLKRYILTDRGRNGGLTESAVGGVSCLPQAQQSLLEHLDDLAAYCRDTWREERDGDRERRHREGVSPSGGFIPQKIKACRALSRGEHPLTNAPLPDTDLACREEMKACFARVARALKRAMDLGYYSAKTPFRLSAEQRERIPITTEGCTLAAFVKGVNAQLPDPTAVEPLFVSEMEGLLQMEGAATFQPCLDDEGQRQCIPTSKGEKLGILPPEDQQGARYSPQAQQYMISLLEKKKSGALNQARTLFRARDYLNRIKWKLDPLSGERLPEDSVLMEEDIHRRLLSVNWPLERIIVHDRDWARAAFAPDPGLRTAKTLSAKTLNTGGMITILNGTCDFTQSKGIGASRLLEYLKEQGLVQCEAQQEGVGAENTWKCYTPTPKGEDVGLERTDECERKGEYRYGKRVVSWKSYVGYTTEGQRFLLDHLDDLAEYIRDKQVYGERDFRDESSITPEQRDKVQRQVEVVRALSQGVHPATHQPLPPTDPACQERLKACFGYVARALERVLELGYYSAKADFSLPRAQWENIPITQEDCPNGEFLEHINQVLPDPTAVQELSPEMLGELLRAEGLMKYGEPDLDRRDDVRYVPTEAGKQLGISPNAYGAIPRYLRQKLYRVEARYSPEAQRHILSLLERYVKD